MSTRMSSLLRSAGLATAAGFVLVGCGNAPEAAAPSSAPPAEPPAAAQSLDNALTPQEQADLVAYLKWADTGTPIPWRHQELFLGTGLAGALILFAGMIVFWPKQRESLSARLRKSGKRKNW